MTSLSTFILPRALFNPALYTALHTTWFQDVPPTTRVASQSAAMRWFGAGPPAERASFDSSCISQFKPALDSISPSQFPLPAVSAYNSELSTASDIAAPFLRELDGQTDEEVTHRTLAFMLLLDQMPRNIFRDSQSLIYSHYDRISRAVLRSILTRTPRPDEHESIRLSLARRMWFYLPLMHSEWLEDHDLIKSHLTELHGELLADGDKETAASLMQSLEFEEKHRVLIERFGRYPHRNRHLGRVSTREEGEHMAGGGEMFESG